MQHIESPASADRISKFMQGNAASCGDLRRRLAVLRFPGGPPSAAGAAAAGEQEIQALERITALQAGTAGWHLALLTAVQGGLLLAQAQHTTDALEAALDTVIAHIRDHAAEPARR